LRLRRRYYNKDKQEANKKFYLFTSYFNKMVFLVIVTDVLLTEMK